MAYESYVKEAVIKFPMSKSKAYELIKSMLFEKWEVKQVVEEKTPDILWVILYDKDEGISYEVSLDLEETSGEVTVHIAADAAVTTLHGSIIFVLAIIVLIVLLGITGLYWILWFILLPLVIASALLIGLPANIGWGIRFINTFIKELRKKIPDVPMEYRIIT